MAYIIAVANQKGGVGKTTTVVNLASFLSLSDKKILVIDSDPQGNATSVLLPEYNGLSFYDDFQIYETNRKNISIGPSSNSLIEQEQLINRSDYKEQTLNKLLNPYKKEFDYILIDCPPSLNQLPINAFASADLVLIPLQCHYYAMEGLGQIMSKLTDLDLKNISPSVSILLTMYDEKTEFCRDIEEEIRDFLSDQCLKTVIPQDIQIAIAPSYSKTILEYAPLSAGSRSYASLSKEIING